MILLNQLLDGEVRSYQAISEQTFAKTVLTYLTQVSFIRIGSRVRVDALKQVLVIVPHDFVECVHVRVVLERHVSSVLNQQVQGIKVVEET